LRCIAGTPIKVPANGEELLTEDHVAREILVRGCLLTLDASTDT
jgi:hypothetical protein